MDNKELILIIGLTVLLSVAVTLTTAQLTGNAVVAWDDSIGGYPSSGYSTSQASVTPVAPVPAKTVTEIKYTVDKSGLVDLLKNADILDGASTTSCQSRCSAAKENCVLALFSDTNNGARLISCGDKSKPQDNRQYKISCVCVNA